jgi:hypothetical protein
MKPTINEFKEFVERSETADVVTWEGEYSGRFYYKGIAVRADYKSDVMDMIDNFYCELGHYDHEDNMGLSRVFAWSLDKFKEEEKEVA